MKKIFLLITILTLCAPALATFTLVQATQSSLHPCGSSTSCSMTVTSTGAGHLGVLILLHSSSQNILQTGAPSGWTHPGGDSGGSCYATGNGNGVDCMYNLSLTGGQTTITWPMSGNTFHDLAYFYEFSFTGSSVSFDAAATSVLTSFSTNPSGPTLTLAGSNDAIVQGLIGSNNAMSTIDGAYTGHGLYDSADSLVAAAYAINTATGTGPTWGNGNNQYVLNAVAFSEASGAAPAAAMKGGAKLAGSGVIK